jgi:hypothetical protein
MRSVILKNIFRFAFRRWDKIPNDELKGYSIYIFLVGLLIGCLLFGLMKVLFKWSFNELIMILLANSVFSFLFSMVIYKREWIDEKYGLGYDGYYIVPGRNEGMSYKAAIVLITTAAPLFSILFFVMGLHYGNIIVATAFLIAMPIPFILMFLRIDAYENKIIVTPKQLDYCPPFYFMLGQLNAMAGLEFSIRTISRLKEEGVKKIKLLCVVAAPEGINLIEKDHPDVQIYCATVDRTLNENAYILPGLGDAGDRVYGTK